MKSNIKTLLVAFIAVFIASVSFGYEVWLGLPYMPKEALTRLDEWDLVADQLVGLNLNNVDTQRPDADRNEMVDWRNIVQQMPAAKDNGIIGFPRTHFNYGTVTTRGTLEEVLVTKFKLALPSRLDATIKWIMPFDNQPGEDRTLPTYEWSDAELQEMRDWLDNNGHADVQMLVNARSFSVRTQTFCKKTIMAGMSIEAKAYLWYGNNGSRQNLLKWAVEEPLTKDKHFKFQMPFGKYDRPDGVTETPFQAMRGFMRWLSTSAMLDSTDFIRRDDVIFLVIIYDDNSNHLPETSTDGTQYQNTILSLALSIIEQKDLFEGRDGLITKEQTMSYARNGAVDPGTEPTSGLVAHWPLDEGSGTVANDASGNEKTGTLLNGATWGSDATRDSYVSFDGTDDRISTTFTYALTDTNDFTWAWWAKKPTAAGTDNGAIMVGSRYGNTGSENYEFIKFTPVSVQFANSDATGAIERYDYADISDSDWHHYAMVKDGTSYQWYVDGAAQGVASNFSYSESSPLPFFIGGDGDNKPNEHFEGFIDDVVLYRVALTQAEIVAVQNGMIPPSDPTGLAATAGVGSVSLDWTDNGESDLVSYNVYRSTTSGSYGAALTNGVATSDYVDNTAINGTTYYYVVTAVDMSSNESGNSNEDSATPQTALNPIIHSYSAAQTPNIPENLLDGDTTDASRWSAQIFPNWVVIDYGAEILIEGARVWTYLDRAYQFTIEASDSPTTGYTMIVDRSTNTSGIQPISDDFAAVSARYLRFTVTGASGYAGDWASITEFDIVQGAFPPVTESPILDLDINGADMVFNWTGSGFKVQARTNLTEGTWLDVPGGEIPPVNVIATNGAAFYRLIELF